MKFPIEKLIILSLFLCLNQVIYAKSYNILDEGAVTDGKTLNTKIIQKTIDLCSQSGGGEVVFTPGNYLTGSLILKSGVFLNLQQGATLLGSTNLDDYLSIKPDFVALRTQQQTKQLIFAEGQTNIGIIGKGTIDGQGKAFVREGNDEGIRRPHGIQLINCKNVRIEGVFMTNSGAWMQHYLACDNLQILGIRVYNHCNYNNDGIDIDGCHDVVISDCIVDSDDDGICLKSTSPRSCLNVTVNNCIVHSHCSSLKLGTESTGGFQNILISNCVVSPCEDENVFYGRVSGESGISVEMVDGGKLDQVSIDHISILNTACPIFIKLGNRARKYSPNAPEPGIGSLSNISITNVTATTFQKVTSNITGIPNKSAENIYLGNILIMNHSNGTSTDSNLEIPENEKEYPTFNMLGNILPASGFYVRHIKNITFDNVKLITSDEELRPAFVLDDVDGAVLLHPQFQPVNKVELCKEISSKNVKIIKP